MSKAISTRRIKAIITREFHEIIRDPMYLALSILVPPFIMLIFGFGLALDVNNLPLGIRDMDQSRLSREYIDSFVRSDSFELKKTYNDDQTLSDDLRTSKLRTALIIPYGFEKDVMEGRGADVQVLIDGTIPLRAEIARGYALGVHSTFLTRLKEYVPIFGVVNLKTAAVNIVSRIEYNPELRSANFVVPGLIATILMFYSAMLTTLSIVREKESQSILAIYCSPITRSELLLGKLIPYLGIAAINFLFTFMLALFVFQVPFKGSWLLLVVASILYVFCTCAFGLTISAVANTQVVAILVTLVLTVLPSFLYSGFFIPLPASPLSTQIISRFIPTTYYLDILRGIFLKGTSWSIHWPSLVSLMIYAAVLYTISFKTFRKRLN